MSYHHITAELGRVLAVIKVVGENKIFCIAPPPPKKNYCGDKKSIWHNLLRRAGTSHEKVGTSQITGASPNMGEL